GIARATACADVYEGFDIPKGTIVIPNVWAIAFAPEGPYDPYKFAPERFFVADGEDMPTDPALWAFGFARRVCPGRYLAENSVFILIATIMTMFDISLPEGQELSPTFTKGLVSYPEPFECNISARSDSKLTQISSRAAQCAV
ncbi:cytochrome P450, partial [Lenzites betulinus]